MADVTRLLDAIEQGDGHAAEELLPLVYEDLRRLAVGRMAAEAPGQTLQPTALVHDAWIRLAGSGTSSYANRGHFFACAAEAMRRILVERARRKACIRRGGEFRRVDIEQIDVAVEDEPEAVLFVHEALETLRAKDPVCAELIKLRFFAGIPNDEAAAMLGLSERTAKRNWAYARTWLARELRKPVSA